MNADDVNVCRECGHRAVKQFFGYFHDEFDWYCSNEKCRQYDERVHVVRFGDWAKKEETTEAPNA